MYPNCRALLVASALSLSGGMGLLAPHVVHAQEQAAESLPHVVILATGGTIASTASTSSDTSNYDVTNGVEQLIQAVPELAEIAVVTGEQVFNVSSTKMGDAEHLALAKRVNEILADPGVAGIVVTHGTETLTQTAYFLHLVTKSDKPVVVVGAMRPASAISADGPLNLFDAVKVAGDPASVGMGTLIVLNDRIGSARFITKTSNWTTDTFKSPEQGYLGDIVAGKVRYYQAPLLQHTTETPFDVSSLDALPMVKIIAASYANDDTAVVNALMAEGVEGIVIGGFAFGAGDELMKGLAETGLTIEKQKTIHGLRAQVLEDGPDAAAAREEMTALASDRGVVVAMSFYQATGQSLYDMSPYLNTNSLDPQKARILMQLALTQTTDSERIQELFDKY